MQNKMSADFRFESNRSIGIDDHVNDYLLANAELQQIVTTSTSTTTAAAAAETTTAAEAGIATTVAAAISIAIATTASSSSSSSTSSTATATISTNNHNAFVANQEGRQLLTEAIICACDNQLQDEVEELFGNALQTSRNDNIREDHDDGTTSSKRSSIFSHVDIDDGDDNNCADEIADCLLGCFQIKRKSKGDRATSFRQLAATTSSS